MKYIVKKPNGTIVKIYSRKDSAIIRIQDTIYYIHYQIEESDNEKTLQDQKQNIKEKVQERCVSDSQNEQARNTNARWNSFVINHNTK